jgi:hypothetical protein
MTQRLLSSWELFLVCTAMVVGCSDAPSAPSQSVPTEREQFISSTEPEGASSIAAAKAIAAEKQPQEVVLIGQILAGQFDPFESGKATFVLTELPEEGHGKGHDSANCPFCKRRAAKAAKVVVQCTDAKGEILPIGAQQLLGLEPNQVVVVSGTGKLNPDLDLFTVEANDIFIRR